MTRRDSTSASQASPASSSGSSGLRHDVPRIPDQQRPLLPVFAQEAVDVEGGQLHGRTPAASRPAISDVPEPGLSISSWSIARR